MKTKSKVNTMLQTGEQTFENSSCIFIIASTASFVTVSVTIQGSWLPSPLRLAWHVASLLERKYSMNKKSEYAEWKKQFERTQQTIHFLDVFYRNCLLDSDFDTKKH